MNIAYVFTLSFAILSTNTYATVNVSCPLYFYGSTCRPCSCNWYEYCRDGVHGTGCWSRGESLDVGQNQACAVLSSGTIQCWNNRVHPPAGSNFRHIAMGHSHGCAIRQDQTLTCWSDFVGSSEVAKLTPTGNRWVQVVSGNEFACALHEAGSVVCWGRFNATTRLKPPHDYNDFIQLSAGDEYICGLRISRSIACWGDDDYLHGRDLSPIDFDAFSFISAGFGHVCVLRLYDSSIECFGREYEGQGVVPEPNSGFARVSVGNKYTCSLRYDGSFTCFGKRSTRKVSSLKDYVSISAGDGFTCSMRTLERIQCFNAFMTN